MSLISKAANWRTRLGLAGLVLSAVLHVQAAEKMDIETHSLLIDKLERVLERGSTAGAHDIEVRLRLADLLAERARLHILAAEGKDSAESKNDRRRALEMYHTAVERAGSQRRALVLIQMAHLYEATGKSSKAVGIYKRVVSEGVKTYPEAVVGQAYTAWGDVLYRQGQFTTALAKFTAALKLRQTERRGYITYRIAWCNLNIGRQSTATARLVEILRTPELLTRKTVSGEEIDKSFHEDVSRDLVIFIARGKVNASNVKLLLDLTPEALRRDNLKALAGETERLGKKKEAIFVWSMILDEEPSVLERIDGRVRLAILEWGLGRKGHAIQQLSIAMDTWKKHGCRDTDECRAIQARARKLIVDWNRLENERVSTELFQAYGLYNAQFDDEYDMQFWAAQTARLLKKYNDASELYRRSSILAANELTKKHDSAIRKMFESALVAQIEMAESGGNLDIKLKAYEHYLDLNPKGERALEVRYQRARVFYDKGRHDVAAEEFRLVALTDTKAQATTRKKAADLALDALVLAKQEGRIESWALEFAKRFPSARTEYLAIARRAVLKEVAAVSNDPKSGDAELKRAARRLSEVKLDGATKDERILVTKNNLVLAVRTRDLEQTRSAADRILSVRGLSNEDREFALEKKVWAAEMQLDFSSAYLWTKQMKLSKVDETDRHLRLAYLAELAGRDPSRHYNDALKTSRSKAKSELAAVRLVRLASRPWNELSRLEGVLKGNRELFAGLVLELYARTGSGTKANKYLARSSVRNTAAGQVISRSMAMQKINAFDKKIAAHRLKTSSDALLQRTLKARLNLIAQADKQAQEAIRSKDWRLQVVTLSIVGRENERLYNEILKLPAPKRLKPEQQKQYAAAIAAQAAPFKAKADEITKKTNEFWRNDKALDEVVATLEKSQGEVTRVVAEDVRQLSLRAQGSARSRLESAIKKSTARPSVAAVNGARRALAKDPFSVRQAKSLKSMEAELGRDAMVAHLDARLEQLEGGAN